MPKPLPHFQVISPMKRQTCANVGSALTTPRAKNRGPVTRARAKRREIIKLAEKLIDMLEPHRREAVQVWIDGMRATKPIYEKGKRVGEEPDWKERRKNAALIIAYLEGKPIEKQIQANAEFEDLQTLMERMNQSPAARVALAEVSLQKTVEGKEIPPALPEPGH
jgi:hypothetical protein